MTCLNFFLRFLEVLEKLKKKTLSIFWHFQQFFDLIISQFSHDSLCYQNYRKFKIFLRFFRNTPFPPNFQQIWLFSKLLRLLPGFPTFLSIVCFSRKFKHFSTLSIFFPIQYNFFPQFPKFLSIFMLHFSITLILLFFKFFHRVKYQLSLHIKKFIIFAIIKAILM